jgi:L-alanine-DL-glutamate epimerase-like enolase superfamily enzyme
VARLSARVGPGELATRLASLALSIDDARLERSSVALPDYPGGPRPSSVARITGKGVAGYGENVAFFESEHATFEATVAAWFTAQRGRIGLTVGNALEGVTARYEHAALQAALIDLALRQAGLSLAALTGVRSAKLRFVKSLAADPEPLRQIQGVRAQGFHGELKIDVEPTWSDATLAALAEDGSIVIFDFKGKGTIALAERLAALNSSALFEDPPPGFEPLVGSFTRVSRDATLPDAQAVESARRRGEAVNLKAPRMSGPLEVLRGLESAPATSDPDPAFPAYLGGMFEVSVGRTQARQIAALYCTEAPNDLAPNQAMPSAAREPSPMLIWLDGPGFG